MKTVFLICFLLAAPYSQAADLTDIPMISDDPETNHKFDVDTFETVAKLLGSSRMAPHLDCELRADLRREVRKYSDGTKWVEYIDVSFKTNAGFAGGDDFKVKFPMSSTYGRKMTANHWTGEGEDFKIRANDYYDHWLRFIHDGRGHIVLIMMGNNMKTYPCKIRGPHGVI